MSWWCNLGNGDMENQPVTHSFENPTLDDLRCILHDTFQTDLQDCLTSQYKFVHLLTILVNQHLCCDQCSFNIRYIRLTHVNVWEWMGKPCSCIQFNKCRYFYCKPRKNPYQCYIQVTLESVSVLYTSHTRIRISTASHTRIHIRYCKSHDNPYQYYKLRENPYQVLQVTR